VVAANLSLSTGLLWLSFDEPILHSSLAVHLLGLQNVSNSTARSALGRHEAINLTSSSRVSNPGVVDAVAIALVRHDLDVIKQRSSLSSGNIFLTAGAGFVEDLLANNARPISSTDGRPFESFEGDLLPPELLHYAFHLDGVPRMEFTFNEPVQEASFDTSRVRLLAANDSVSIVLPRGLQVAYSSLGTDGVLVYLDENTTNAIKLVPLLGSDASNARALLSAGAVQDFAANSIVAMTSADAKVPDPFVADSTGPLLVGFALDINLAQLTLTFNEVVLGGDLVNASGIRLLSRQDGAAEGVQITQGSQSLSQGRAQQIRLQIGTQDLNQIKVAARVGLGLNRTATFLIAAQHVVKDVFGNPVVPIAEASESLAVDSLVADSVSPALVGYELDMNEGVVSLDFDEAVDVRAFNATPMRFFTANNATAEVVLPFPRTDLEASWSPELPTRVRVRVGLQLLNALKAAAFGLQQNATFIMAEAALLRDFAGNPSSRSPAVLARSLVLDSTLPTLLHVHLDMEVGRLRLVFDEAMEPSRVTPSAVSLEFETSQVTLNSSVGRPFLGNSTSVVLELSAADRDLIQLSVPLGHSLATTLVTLAASAAADMAGNELAPMQRRPLDSFERDGTGPHLTAFGLDMTRGILSLTFSEIVEVDSALRTKLLLLAGPNATDLFQLLP
jgi:hypothetical protein